MGEITAAAPRPHSFAKRHPAVTLWLAFTALFVLLAGVWIAMAADLILRGVLCALRWRGGRWERKCGLDQVPAGTAS